MNTDPLRIGKYELQQCLGRGGMGEVWKAFDPQLQRHVAIKLLHPDLQAAPDFLTRFEREARIIASLHHPNIVQIYDFQLSKSPASERTVAYMVMEYIEGQTLADYIRSTSSGGKFPPPVEIVHLFASISMAVDYAHRKGMIHRDLKPANILLDKRNSSPNSIGEPVLTDFGLAKLLGNSTGSQSGSWVSTPLYISPEQAMGSSGNERSDIYALGVILYEICTGVRPFQGDNSAAIMHQHINALPTSPVLLNPAIRPALTMVILRGLAKDPTARFPSAASLTVALAEAFNLPVPAKLELLDYPTDSANEPTYFKRLQSKPLSMSGYEEPTVTPSSPRPTHWQPMANAPSGLPAAHPTLSPLTTTPQARESTPITPVPSSVIAVSPVPGSITTLPTPRAPSPPPPLWRKPQTLLIALLALLIVLAGSGLGAWFLLPHQNVGTVDQIVGHAYFVSSGHVGKSGFQGVDDEMLVDLHNLPSPAQGKSYYVWLLSDKNQVDWHPLLLGTLSVTQGRARLSYSDPQYTNLLGLASRLLITEESSSIMPTNPDPHAWLYYAELPQNILDHLRYLLSNDPMVKEQGGLDLWLFRNTQKVMEWAGSARGYWLSKNTQLMRSHFIRILEYLKGTAPIGTANTLLPVQLPSVALLGADTPGTTIPDYLHAIGGHVTAIAQVSDAKTARRALANDINTAINNTRSNLEKVYQDAKDLLASSDAELLQPQALVKLNDLSTQAFYSYVGQLDPTTNRVDPAVIQLHYDIQSLATFDITAYQSQ